MIIFPAIDIKTGRVVRLSQGKFDQVTEYSKDPLMIAQKWKRLGATWLHVVDLDGAQTGEMSNINIVLEIAKFINIPIQVGGGIRRKDHIVRLLEGHVARIILGTKVVEDRTFLKDVLTLWPKKIAVSLDCHNGMVAQRGWTTTSNIKAVDLVKELEAMGLTCLIYTDIARDGMLSGPNLNELKNILSTTKIPVIASGGISSLQDIENLLALKSSGLIGAITGKAIYEGKLQLEEAIKLCSKSA